MIGRYSLVQMCRNDLARLSLDKLLGKSKFGHQTVKWTEECSCQNVSMYKNSYKILVSNIKTKLFRNGLIIDLLKTTLFSIYTNNLCYIVA